MTTTRKTREPCHSMLTFWNCLSSCGSSEGLLVCEECQKGLKNKTDVLGNYSMYGFEMKLTRSMGPFILSVYLPSAMFVTMSWVSFYIPPVKIFFFQRQMFLNDVLSCQDAVPARIVLLVTLCLVLINMINTTFTRMPVCNTVNISISILMLKISLTR